MILALNFQAYKANEFSRNKEILVEVFKAHTRTDAWAAITTYGKDGFAFSALFSASWVYKEKQGGKC